MRHNDSGGGQLLMLCFLFLLWLAFNGFWLHRYTTGQMGSLNKKIRTALQKNVANDHGPVPVFPRKKVTDARKAAPKRNYLEERRKKRLRDMRELLAKMRAVGNAKRVPVSSLKASERPVTKPVPTVRVLLSDFSSMGFKSGVETLIRKNAQGLRRCAYPPLLGSSKKLTISSSIFSSGRQLPFILGIGYPVTVKNCIKREISKWSIPKESSGFAFFRFKLRFTKR